jgi:hypothetical protein
MLTRILTTATAVGMVATAANALSVTPTNDAAAMVAAVLAPSSGITVVGGSEAIVIGAATQQGTYTDFNLSPSSGSGPSFNLPDGVVLTSGTANFPLTNTVNNFSVNSGTSFYQPLRDLAASVTPPLSTSQSNANALSFDFTVDDSELNSISVKFLFATDEWPTQSVTDIMGIFVNGVNYAFFEDGTLVSNQPGNTEFFTLNPVGAGLYPIEWNGLTKVDTMVGLINPGEVNNITFAISDTSDTIFDSAVFIGGMVAGFTEGGGGIDPGDPGVIPVPAAFPLLLTALGGLGLMRRRRKAA